MDVLAFVVIIMLCRLLLKIKLGIQNCNIFSTIIINNHSYKGKNLGTFNSMFITYLHKTNNHIRSVIDIILKYKCLIFSPTAIWHTHYSVHI